MVLLHVIRCAAAHCVTIVLSCCVLRCSPACCVIVAWSCIVPQHGPACRVVITRSCIDAMVRCSPTCHHHTVTPGCAAPRCVAVSPSHHHTRVCSAPHRVVPSHCGALLPIMLLSRRRTIALWCTAPHHVAVSPLCQGVLLPIILCILPWHAAAHCVAIAIALLPVMP